MFPSCGMASL